MQINKATGVCYGPACGPAGVIDKPCGCHRKALTPQQAKEADLLARIRMAAMRLEIARLTLVVSGWA